MDIPASSDKKASKRQKVDEIDGTYLVCDMCCDYHENLQLPNTNRNRLVIPINFDVATNPLVDGSFFAIKFEYFQERITELLGLRCTHDTDTEKFLTYQDDRGEYDQDLVATLIDAALSRFPCSGCTTGTRIEFGEPNQFLWKSFEMKDDRKRVESAIEDQTLNIFGKSHNLANRAYFHHSEMLTSCPSLPRLRSYLCPCPSHSFVPGMRDTIRCFTSNQISRLFARSGVVLSIEKDPIHEDIRKSIFLFCGYVLRDAAITARHRRQGPLRQFITSTDIQSSLRDQHRILVYGCGMDGLLPSLWTDVIQEIVTISGHKPFSFQGLSVVNDLMTSLMHFVLETAKDMPSGADNKATIPGATLPCAFFDVEYRNLKATFLDFSDAPGDDLFQKLKQRTPHSETFLRDEATLDVDGCRVYRGKAKVLDYLDIRSAVDLRFSRYHDLRPSASKSAEKSYQLFKSSGNLSMLDAKVSAQLTVNPLLIGLVANRAPNLVYLTPEASIYLAAVLDYLMKEIIDTINGFDVEDELILSSQDIFRALAHDEDFSDIFLSNREVRGFIKNGGVEATVLGLPTTPSHKPSLPFEDLFLDLLGTQLALIDPRDGKHKRLVESQTCRRAIEVPEFDAACLQSQEERKSLARSSLPRDMSDLLKQEEENCEDTRQYESVLHEQDRADKIFERLAFRLLMQEHLRSGEHDSRSFKVTTEAVDIFQVATEGFLIELIRVAADRAIQGGSDKLTTADITWARSLTSMDK